MHKAQQGPARLPASLHHSRWGCGGFVSPQDPKKHQQECSPRPRIQPTVGITQKEWGPLWPDRCTHKHTCTEAHKHAQKQTRRVQSHSVDTHVLTANILKCITAHMHVCTWQAHTCADTAEMVHKGSCCLSSARRTISFWHLVFQQEPDRAAGPSISRWVTPSHSPEQIMPVNRDSKGKR